LRLDGLDNRRHRTQNNNMKKLFVTTAVALSAMVLLTGCLALQIGGGDTKSEKKTTVGQQLVDLKTAHDSGAISDADYETQKAKVLSGK
jgi:Short C-terminal domain